MSRAGLARMKPTFGLHGASGSPSPRSALPLKTPMFTNCQCRSLHVATRLRTGRAEEGVLDLIRVSRQRGRDDRLVVLEEDETRGLRDIPVAAVQRRGSFDRSLGGRLAEHVASLVPRVVHTHDPQALRAAIGAVRTMDAPPRIVASFHGVPSGGWIARWLTRRASRRAAALSAPTKELAGTLQAMGWIDGDVHVVAPGVDVDVYRPSGDEDRWRERLGIPDNCTAVGFAGARDDDEVIAVHRELQRLSPGAHLVLVAPGSSRDQVGRKIRSTNDVHVLVRGQRAPFYRCLDAFAFGNGRDTETRVLHEAMASGVPGVIASTKHGRAFVTGPEGPALMLVNPDSPERLAAGLKRLLDDGRRIQYGHAARHRALEIGTSQAAFADLERLYAEVAPAPRPKVTPVERAVREIYRPAVGARSRARS